MKMQQDGYDLFQVQDFLEQKRLYSLDDYIVKENLMNPGYFNPLNVPLQMNQMP